MVNEEEDFEKQIHQPKLVRFPKLSAPVKSEGREEEEEDKVRYNQTIIGDQQDQ